MLFADKSEIFGAEISSIRFQDFDNKELKNRLVESDYWTVVLFSSVEGRVQIVHEDVDIGSGDLVIIPPKTSFMFSRKDSVEEEIFASGSVTQFSVECLPHALRNLPESESIFSLVNLVECGAVGRPKDIGRSLTRLRSIKRARGMLRLARLYVFLELISHEVVWKTIAKKQKEKGLSVKGESRLMAIKRYSEHRLNSNLSRDEVANHVGMEPSAFSRFFKRATGMKFVDYVATLRVQSAARLLTSHRSLTVEEVARRCGFRNQSAFNIQFKKRLGTTPRQYRKNVDIEPISP